MENLKYARPDSSDEEIFAAARTLGCHERFLKIQNGKGYAAEVGEKGSALSIGERQLVCFTRALVADPKILLLDEATSSLDPLTSHQVQMALSRLSRGRTTFIVTHRLNTVREADLILMIEDGRVVEMGTHRELLACQGPYARLVQSSEVSHASRSPTLEVITADL
jgi:ABC-type multidrug transport system fused ATPase/permease subunit